jgi:hypothetical protein
MGSQLDPVPLSRVGSQERALGPNFPQLDIGEPSSGFTPGPRSASDGMIETRLIDDDSILGQSLQMQPFSMVVEE